MKTTFIYSLNCPITNEPRYIGKADNLESRLATHLKEKGKYYKVYWIQNLIKKGLKPTIEEIDSVSKDDWQFWEKHYISLYKSWGFRLVNGTEGGEGGNTHITKEGRERLRLSKLGNKWNIGRKHLFYKRKTGYTFNKPCSEDLRIKRSIIMKNRWKNIPKEERINMTRKGREACILKIKLYGKKKGYKTNLKPPWSKLTLNLETGIYYNSIRDAYQSSNLNVSENHFRAMLTGRYKNKTNFIIPK